MKKLIASSIGLYLLFTITAFADETLHDRMVRETIEGIKAQYEADKPLREAADAKRAKDEKETKDKIIDGILNAKINE